MQMAVQEFYKLHVPKINKLKGGYSPMANLIFQSCLNDIKVHVEWKLSQREAIQLVKDFMAEHAHDEVEFYMWMVAEEQQMFEGLYNTLKELSSLGRL